jgi:DNA-binding transcriptional LysR family regulator
MKDNRLTEMHVFRLLVETGGFTAASQAMGVSQSFVSQTMSGLERRLGVQLLYRSTRDRRLTEQGQLYFDYCVRIIDDINRHEGQMSSSMSQLSGELRVSAPLSFGSDQIAPRLAAFQALHPGLKMSLLLTDKVVNLIEENIDVAIRMGKLQDSSLVSRKLCDLQRVVVASPSYLEQHGVPAHPRDLSGHNCLLWDDSLKHLNRWPFLVDGQRQHVTVVGTLRSNNGLTLVELCTAGAGILRAAEHVSLPAIHANRLVPLLAEYQAHDDTAIYVVHLADRQLLPKIRAYVGFLMDTFRDPPWLALRRGDAEHAPPPGAAY